MQIHPTAVIEPSAKLGQGITVGPYAYIASNTQIGDGCCVGPHTVIHPYTTLGNGCRIHAGAVIGDLPQDLAFKGEVSFVRVGNHSILREGVTIHRGTQADSVTRVGDHCLLMANSHVGHNAALGDRVIMANGALVGGYAEIGDGAFISGNCLIHQFTRVGRLAMMSGGSAAQKDIPPFCMTQSSTSNTLIGLNVVGLRRANFTSQERQQLKTAFKLLFCSGTLISTAIEQLEASSLDPFVLELCNFIKTSQRGVSRAVQPKNRNSGDQAAHHNQMEGDRSTLERAFQSNHSDEVQP
jgi:UDP-N-acetylglucosamine acyltransferase